MQSHPPSGPGTKTKVKMPFGTFFPLNEPLLCLIPAMLTTAPGLSGVGCGKEVDTGEGGRQGTGVLGLWHGEPQAAPSARGCYPHVPTVISLASLQASLCSGHWPGLAASLGSQATSQVTLPVTLAGHHKHRLCPKWPEATPSSGRAMAEALPASGWYMPGLSSGSFYLFCSVLKKRWFSRFLIPLAGGHGPTRGHPQRG